eukprot:g348.t1
MDDTNTNSADNESNDAVNKLDEKEIGETKPDQNESIASENKEESSSEAAAGDQPKLEDESDNKSVTPEKGEAETMNESEPQDDVPHKIKAGENIDDDDTQAGVTAAQTESNVEKSNDAFLETAEDSETTTPKVDTTTMNEVPTNTLEDEQTSDISEEQSEIVLASEGEQDNQTVENSEEEETEKSDEKEDTLGLETMSMEKENVESTGPENTAVVSEFDLFDHIEDNESSNESTGGIFSGAASSTPQALTTVTPPQTTMVAEESFEIAGDETKQTSAFDFPQQTALPQENLSQEGGQFSSQLGASHVHQEQQQQQQTGFDATAQEMMSESAVAPPSTYTSSTEPQKTMDGQMNGIHESYGYEASAHTFEASSAPPNAEFSDGTTTEQSPETNLEPVEDQQVVSSTFDTSTPSELDQDQPVASSNHSLNAKLIEGYRSRVLVRRKNDEEESMTFAREFQELKERVEKSKEKIRDIDRTTRDFESKQDENGNTGGEETVPIYNNYNWDVTQSLQLPLPQPVEDNRPSERDLEVMARTGQGVYRQWYPKGTHAICTFGFGGTIVTMFPRSQGPVVNFVTGKLEKVANDENAEKNQPGDIQISSITTKCPALQNTSYFKMLKAFPTGLIPFYPLKQANFSSDIRKELGKYLMDQSCRILDSRKNVDLKSIDNAYNYAIEEIGTEEFSSTKHCQDMALLWIVLSLFIQPSVKKKGGETKVGIVTKLIKQLSDELSSKEDKTKEGSEEENGDSSENHSEVSSAVESFLSSFPDIVLDAPPKDSNALKSWMVSMHMELSAQIVELERYFEVQREKLDEICRTQNKQPDNDATLALNKLESVEQIEKSLLEGDREGALKAALQNRLFSHSLIISSVISDRHHKDVIRKFIEHEFDDNESLKTLYTMLGGVAKTTDKSEESSSNGSAPTTTNTNSMNWRKTIRAILANPTAGDNKIVRRTAKMLWNSSKSYMSSAAAHICCILSGDARCGNGDNASSVQRSSTTGTGASSPAPITLLGADPRFGPDFITIEAIQRSLVLEYAHCVGIRFNGYRSGYRGYGKDERDIPLGTKKVPNASLVAFKLIYVTNLLEMGLWEKASELLTSIYALHFCSQAYQQYGKDVGGVFTIPPTVMEQMKILSDRIATLFGRDCEAAAQVIVEDRTKEIKSEFLKRSSGQQAKSHLSDDMMGEQHGGAAGLNDDFGLKGQPDPLHNGGGATTLENTLPTAPQEIYHGIHRPQQISEKKGPEKVFFHEETSSEMVKNSLRHASKSMSKGFMKMFDNALDQMMAPEGSQVPSSGNGGNGNTSHQPQPMMSDAHMAQQMAQQQHQSMQAHNSTSQHLHTPQQHSSSSTPNPTVPSGNSASQQQTNANNGGTAADDDEKTRTSSGSSGGFFSSLKGIFASKEDQRKIAKGEGKSMEAYFDKALGKWVFPDDDPDSATTPALPPPPKMNMGMGGGATGVNTQAHQPQQTSTTPGMSTPTQQQATGPTGAPVGTPNANMTSGSAPLPPAGGFNMNRPRRGSSFAASRYASFGNYSKPTPSPQQNSGSGSQPSGPPKSFSFGVSDAKPNVTSKGFADNI